MKPRTLARIALQKIKEGIFIFDTEERKKEAVRQMKRIVSGRPPFKNEGTDPIAEIHISIFTPNFDYPLVPTNDGKPFVWQEDHKYIVPGYGTHIVRGVSINDNRYNLQFCDSLAPFRSAIVKVDKYTDPVRAAHALVCTMCSIENKKEFKKEKNMTDQLVLSDGMLMKHWDSIPNKKEFEDKQKHLYVKWLQKWIEIYHKSPGTHMKVLKLVKNIINNE